MDKEGLAELAVEATSDGDEAADAVATAIPGVPEVPPLVRLDNGPSTSPARMTRTRPATPAQAAIRFVLGGNAAHLIPAPEEATRTLTALRRDMNPLTRTPFNSCPDDRLIVGSPPLD
jgi:hypothetical protein